MITKDYILPIPVGRLGNNMFIIAHGYALGLQYNKQVVVVRSHVDYDDNRYSQNIFKKLTFIETMPNGVANPDVPSDSCPSIYHGHYASDMYFKDYAEEVRELFSPPSEFIERIKQELPFIFDRLVITVIHVRRGDYLGLPNYHPTISKEYILKAIEQVPGECYLISSDDIEWCKENLDLPNSYYLEGYPPHESMWILSLCHHFVTCNSTFSWWSAWLSRYENKIVIAPEIWFGPHGPKNDKELHCEGWIVIPSYFENGLILPK